MTPLEKRQRLVQARAMLADEYKKQFSYKGMHFVLTKNRLYSDDYSLYLEIDPNGNGVTLRYAVEKGN